MNGFDSISSDRGMLKSELEYCIDKSECESGPWRGFDAGKLRRGNEGLTAAL